MAEGNENLLGQLQRNLKLMRALDQRTDDLRAKVEKLATEYMSSIGTLSSRERMAVLKQIQEATDKCKECSDNKLRIAAQSCEMVDRHIQHIDAYLASIEADLKLKLTESSDDDSSCSKRKRSEEEGGALREGQTQKKQKAAHDLSKGKNSDEEALKAVQKLKFPCTRPAYGLPAGASGSVSSSHVLDVPVDPHEATSCLCHQVSYGEMIGCDSPDCTIKWFHLACVGLTTKPQGKWFCPSCFQGQKKK